MKPALILDERAIRVQLLRTTWTGTAVGAVVATTHPAAAPRTDGDAADAADVSPDAVLAQRTAERDVAWRDNVVLRRQVEALKARRAAAVVIMASGTASLKVKVPLHDKFSNPTPADVTPLGSKAI